MIKDKRQRIYQMLERGCKDSEIRKRIGRISTESLAAYKASAKRAQQRGIGAPLDRLSAYIGNRKAISIPVDAIEKRLSNGQIPKLVRILDQALPAESRRVDRQIREQSYAEKNGSFHDDVREVVIGLLDRGVPKEKVYSDRRLKGVNKGTITAFISNYTRGSYSK